VSELSVHEFNCDLLVIVWLQLRRVPAVMMMMMMMMSTLM